MCFLGRIGGTRMRWLVAAAALVAGSVQADVVRLEVRQQHDWAGAQAFGAGPYEYLAGTAWYGMVRD